MEEFVVVEGWGLKENKSGEWLKSLGKLESFKKLIEMLAIELDEEVAWELWVVVLARVLEVEVSGLVSHGLSLVRWIVLLMLGLLMSV